MRKLLISQMVTLDGFFSGPNGELDWHMVDEEFNTWAIDQLDSVDTLVFGRVTYEFMASWWPTPAAIEDDQEVARRMNTKAKLVFSKTLDTAEWANTRVVKTDPAGEIRRLKAQPGQDMVIFGSGQITSLLAAAGLIDEYRILTCPVVLGKGVPLFSGLAEPVRLRTLSSRLLKNGVTLCSYAPEGG